MSMNVSEISLRLLEFNWGPKRPSRAATRDSDIEKRRTFKL